MAEIPTSIRELMREDELENMRNRDGWATGTVALVDETGDIADRIENAWIELFDGEGAAAASDGVRFMAVRGDGEYEEAYAHEDRDTLERRRDGEAVGERGTVTGSYPAWFVEEYDS